MPNLEDQYYNHDDDFDNFSCFTGDYRAESTITDDSSITIKVESDLDDCSFGSDTETLCDSDTVSQFQFESASTIYTTKSQARLNGNEAVVIGAVGVNEHEGMSYDLLADGLEAYDYDENVLQTGN